VSNYKYQFNSFGYFDTLNCGFLFNNIMNRRFKILSYLFKLFILLTFLIVRRWSKSIPWYHFLPFWPIESMLFFLNYNIRIMLLHQIYWFQHNFLSRFKFLTPSHKFNLWVYIFNLTFYSPKILWGDFLSLYFWFYEATILENTYATGERKNGKCISRC